MEKNKSVFIHVSIPLDEYPVEGIDLPGGLVPPLPLHVDAHELVLGHHGAHAVAGEALADLFEKIIKSIFYVVGSERVFSRVASGSGCS